MKFNRITKDIKEQLFLDSKNMTTKELSIKYNKASSSINQLLRTHNLKSKPEERRKFDKSFNENIFSKYTEESCYIAGFIAADGCIRNDRVLSIKISIVDLELLEKISKIIGGYKPIIYKNVCSLYINSLQIINDLKNNFNITPRKTFTLKFPIQIPIEFRHHFIRGYFDGDGCIFKTLTNPKKINTSKIKLRYTILGTYDLLNGILNSLPFENHYKIKPKKNIFYFSLYKNAFNFYTYIYNNYTICLLRKKEKADNILSAFS